MNQHPLRKIVREYDKIIHKDPDTGLETTVRIEVLSCGHEMRPTQDFYGRTNANRRRCKECGQIIRAERYKLVVLVNVLAEKIEKENDGKA